MPRTCLLQRPENFKLNEGGALNDHHTQAESTTALRKAYGEVFGRCGDDLHQSALATVLYSKGPRGRMLARDHAFHNSLWKVAALQAQHGYQRYLVVLRGNPTGRDAERYIKAGLIFCTLQTLPDLLQKIELMRHGFFIPFYTRPRITIFPSRRNSAATALPPAEMQFIDRSRFLASVATFRTAVATQLAQDTADLAVDIMPY